MPPTPARLAPVPLEWWQNVALFSPVAVLVAALIAALINWRILKQRTRSDAAALEQKREADRNALDQKTAADSRAEWWRRAQWALEQALSDDEDTKTLGLATLDVLAHSELARKEELELFDIAWKTVNGSAEVEAAVDPGIPQPLKTRVYFHTPDDTIMELEVGTSITGEDMQELGEYLRHHEGQPWFGPVDSDENMGDNEGTDPGEHEEDKR